MTLTRRQLIALLLGAAAGPAIAAPNEDAPITGWSTVPALEIGDVFTFVNDPRQWIVTEVFPRDDDEIATIEPYGWRPPVPGLDWPLCLKETVRKPGDWRDLEPFTKEKEFYPKATSSRLR